jgi:TPP-dependent pyruvate/acetoin dehydrogenase alpha subunit
VSLDAAVDRVRAADKALNAATPLPFPVPIGNLAPVVAGSLEALGRGDWWVPGLRERVGAVLRDVPIERLADGLAGARPYKVAPPSPSPALRALHAVGLAVADRTRCALVHLGIGSVADGAFAEALNLAALLRPNVIFVVAVHPLGPDAPVGPQSAATPSDLARAYGIPAVVVDGSSAAAVHTAVTAAKTAGGPQLIEARLA